jgi:hypothetical protein
LGAEIDADVLFGRGKTPRRRKLPEQGFAFFLKRGNDHEIDGRLKASNTPRL